VHCDGKRWWWCSILFFLVRDWILLWKFWVRSSRFRRKPNKQKMWKLEKLVWYKACVVFAPEDESTELVLCFSYAGVRAIYCHATSKDGAKADPEGEIRAERLAKAAASAGVEHIVYNSSGAIWLNLIWDFPFILLKQAMCSARLKGLLWGFWALLLWSFFRIWLQTSV